MKAKGADRSKPLGEVTFVCAHCLDEEDGKKKRRSFIFKASPARVENDPDRPHHPWRYAGACPNCKAQCEQAPFERALLKAWVSATGPTSPEGKAAAAENLKGHPTEEESKRTRFNAMQHGLNARVATYFPAKPDGYAFCASCDVNRGWCAAQPACVKRTEHFMLHHAAFEQKDPRHLMPIYADTHAAIYSILQMILQQLIADGVKITAPCWFSDKDGGFHLAEYQDGKDGPMKKIMEITAHPLLKPLGELIKSANLSLGDMGMTVKAAEASDEDMGQLGGSQQPKEGLTEFQTRVLGVMEGLSGKMDRARKQTDEDPVLLEYNQQTGIHEPVPPKPGAQP